MDIVQFVTRWDIELLVIGMTIATALLIWVWQN